jgi:hypothetical protein
MTPLRNNPILVSVEPWLQPADSMNLEFGIDAVYLPDA